MLKMRLFSLLMRLGVFRIPAVRNCMYRLYFALKRRYFDIYHDLIMRHPELFRGGFILDAGANIGCTATFFSRVISDGFLVYAFEPAPDNFFLLQNCIVSYHNEKKVVAIRAAVGEQDGRVELRINKRNHTAHRVFAARPEEASADTFQEVPLLSLDSFCTSHKIHPVRFVKIDVEGYELFVCRGMTGIIAANPGVVIGLEFGSSSQTEVRDEHKLLEFLTSLSLNLYTVSKGELRRCSLQELGQIIERRKTADILASKQALVAGQDLPGR